MIFDLKGEERQKGFVKLQNALFPSNNTAKVAELISLCPPVDAEFFSTISQYIHGEGEDSKENRLFLRTAVNRDGPNFRSPFSNTFYPAVSKGHTSPENAELEAQLNGFLDHYARVCLPGAASSAFVLEGKDSPLFCFALAKRGREERAERLCAHAYEVFSQVRFVRKELVYKFSVAANLKYELELGAPARGESASYEGSLNCNFSKTISLSSAMSREEMVEVVAGLFERSEVTLRNALLCSAMRAHRGKVEEALQRPAPPAEARARLFEEFRAANAREEASPASSVGELAS